MLYSKFFVSLLLLVGIISAATGSYTVVLSPEGNSLVIAEFSSTHVETLNVPLPLDATDFRVSGALYVPASNGIDISLTGSESGIVIFNSALLVTGSGNNYRFSLDLAGIPNVVTVSLPKNVVVQSTNPQTQITQTTQAVNIIWSSMTTPTVSIQYTLGTGGVSGGDSSTLIVVALIIAVVVAVFLVMRFKKKV